MNTLQMNAEQSLTPSDFASTSSSGKPSPEAPAVRPASLKDDQPPAKPSWSGKLAPLASARHLIVLLIGVGATLAWQTYGDAARHIAPPPVFSLDQQQFNAISLHLDAMQQSADGLATSIASNQERTMHSIDQLAAGQEQMIRQIAKFQALDQFVLVKKPAPPPRPAPVLARKPVPRQQARTALTPARNP